MHESESLRIAALSDGTVFTAQRHPPGAARRVTNPVGIHFWEVSIARPIMDAQARLQFGPFACEKMGRSRQAVIAQQTTQAHVRQKFPLSLNTIVKCKQIRRVDGR